MEYIRGGWVVYDDDPAQITAEAVQVFDVVAAVEDATVTEQPRAEHAPSETFIYVLDIKTHYIY